MGSAVSRSLLFRVKQECRKKGDEWEKKEPEKGGKGSTLKKVDCSQKSRAPGGRSTRVSPGHKLSSAKPTLLISRFLGERRARLD